jgi:protein-L-isoaspartate(D-aspartate) O-methyltransferase
MDSQVARSLMVDGQVRPNKVTDTRITDAMRRLPREAFVPAQCAAIAYADEDVPLGGGRYLMEPMVIARLVQMAAPQSGERALVVAAGTGYGAALLAACGMRVVALEDDPALLALARPALAAAAPGVALVEGPAADGWAGEAPYDVILIDGAVERVPQAIGAQLAPGGRLVTVHVDPDRGGAARIGQAVRGEMTASGLSLQAVFDCAVPLLPALRQVRGFVF